MEFVPFSAKEAVESSQSTLTEADLDNDPQVEGFLKEMIGQVEKAVGGDVPTMALSGGTPPPRGTRELIQLYSQSPWLRAIVNKIAKSVANTQWQMFSLSGGKDFSATFRMMDFDKRQKVLFKGDATSGLKPIEKHPLLDLLEFGNESMGGDGVMQLSSTYNDLVGEVMLLMERDGLGMPVQLWPIPPFWIQELPTKKKPFFKLQPKSGAQLLVPITEVIWIKDPDPASPYGRGSGIAKSLGDEIEIDEYSAKHMKSFFYNRARPDIIVSGDNISPEDAKRLEQKWLQNHQGFWKAFKPLFFSRKVDIKELTQNFENIQMVNVRQHERDTFIQVFGAPPEKFGIVNESKRSTISAADYFWSKDVIQPRVEYIRRGLQRQLVPIFGDNILLHYDSPVIQDKEFKLDVMRRATWAYSLNDWRELSGHDSWGEDGDIVLLPLNHQFVPIEDLSEGAVATTEEEPEEEESEENEEEEKPKKKPEAGMILADLKKNLAGSVRIKVAEIASKKLLAPKANDQKANVDAG